jgi:polysaccharide pyruvyl transferase WcaK-like protein
MYKVCFMGASFDSGNMGVSALAASLVRIISQLRPDAQISFFVGARSPARHAVSLGDRTVEVGIVNYRMSPRSPIKQHLLWLLLMACLQRITPFPALRRRVIEAHPALRMLAEADLVGDIRGGDSFSDIYGLRSFLLGSVPALITLLVRDRLVLLPQTYGPYKSAIARAVARFILARSVSVLSRDAAGVSVAQGLLGVKARGKTISFCPDVAFALASVRPETLKIDPPLDVDPSVPLIGFNVSGLLFNGGFTRGNMFRLATDYQTFAHLLAKRLLRESDVHLLLVPHTFAPAGHVESDNDACAQIQGSLSSEFQGRVHIVASQYDQSAIKAVIGLCHFFIGSRMHACIASLSQGIPTIGVAYSDKFKGVFESVGAGDLVIDARDMKTDVAISQIVERFRTRAELRQIANGRAELARKDVFERFEALLSSAAAFRHCEFTEEKCGKPTA